MKRKLYFAAFAAVALASCNETLPINPGLDDGKVELEVNLPVALTRVPGESDDDDVNTLQVFVFDPSGKLEAYEYDYADAVSLKCLPGTKTVAALVNAPLIPEISSYSQLTSTVSRLSNNVLKGLVMEGKMEVDLSTSQKVVVPVSRLVAKITLSKIENAMDLDYHRKMEFILNSVYLVNVAGDKKYLVNDPAETWINKGVNEKGSLVYVYDTLNDTKLSYLSSYTDKHYFYCYPNHTEQDGSDTGEWSPRYTRLVVEATLGGEKCYYPVSLPKVEQNTTYDISIKVTRPGSDSPDKPVSTYAAEFTVEVNEWIPTDAIEEII